MTCCLTWLDHPQTSVAVRLSPPRLSRSWSLSGGRYRRLGRVADIGKLRIGFSLRGLDGVIDVALARNTDPGSLGHSLLFGGRLLDSARDFPVCRARLTYPADGYGAVFGWTQLVRESPELGFEMDPIAIYGDVSTPYAWFGLKPELFDAPSRDARYDMDWEAHSFLCVSPDAVITPRVQAITGFSWGFAFRGSDTVFSPPAVLNSDAWNSHLPLLRATYPGWTFDAGYLGGASRQGPVLSHFPGRAPVGMRPVLRGQGSAGGRRNVDDTVVLQPVQHLADRRAADAELRSEAALGGPSARCGRSYRNDRRNRGRTRRPW
jgi:hypothetical protein